MPSRHAQPLSHKVDWYNEKLIGDWIDYVLRKG
jgi:hypothetical protein